MLTSVPITVLFIGLFALIQVPMTVMVGYRRVQTNIQFFDGGDQTLLRRMRAHGNYTETVPIVLLAMAASEVSGISHWALWAGGVSLLVGRLMHAAILVTKGWGNPRAIGMLLTFAPMVGFGAWSVHQGLVWAR
ncbi:MAG: MAPEG family protein [Rhodocyclaceae bacterium]|nr:MAPEG family protein [Rhodocyclaceae bacterium]